MKLSRRDLTRIAAAGALVTQAGPAAAFFHNPITLENLPERLASDLGDMLKPDCEGSFSVPVHVVRDAPFWSIDATVVLHWPPGWRSRAFSGAGNDIKDAYAELLAAVRGHYGAVWTMPDGSGCFT